jgi:hypothetical protein
MNTVGKILVILNFVFALVVGGFLAIDFATRTNWHKAYKALEKEIQVQNASRGAVQDTAGNISAASKDLQLKLDELKQKVKDEQDAAKAMETTLGLQIDDLKNKLKDGDLSVAKSQAAVARMVTEVAHLNTVISAREKHINALDGDVKKFRQEAISNENLARTLQARSEELVKQVQEINSELARVKAGAGGTETSIARNPNEPNPPSVRVQGEIEAVDKLDRGLVQISLGSDNGVNKNHTLEVFRLGSQPEYLGMVRIVDASAHKSVGRLVQLNGVAGGRKTLQAGDKVASYIMVK